MLSRFAAGSVKSGAGGRFETSSTTAAGASEEPVAPVFSTGLVSCPHATATSVKTPISIVAATKFLIFEMGFMGCSSILVQGAPVGCS